MSDGLPWSRWPLLGRASRCCAVLLASSPIAHILPARSPALPCLQQTRADAQMPPCRVYGRLLLGPLPLTDDRADVQGKRHRQQQDSRDAAGSQEDADERLQELEPLLRWVRKAASSCDYSTMQAAQWKIVAMLWSEE